MGFDVEEYRKNRKSQQEKKEETEEKGFDVEAYRRSRNAPKVGEEIATRVNSWLKDNEDFVNSYNSRYGETSSSYRADSSDWLSKVTSYTRGLGKEAESIKSLLEQYSDFYDPEWVKSISDALDSTLSIHNDIVSNSTKDHEYWSQWKDEDTYKRDMADWLEDDAELSEDKIAQRRERYQSNADRIAELKDQYEHTGIGIIDKTINAVKDTWSTHVKGETEKEYEAIEKELAALEAENRRYEREQQKLDNYFVPETEEFLQNAAFRNYGNPTVDDVEAYWKSTDYAPTEPTDKLGFYQNDYLPLLDEIEARQKEAEIRGEDYRTTIPAEYVALYQEGRDGSWEELEDKEIDIYYNLLKTEGQEAAYRFLDAMKPTLNKRATEAMAKNVSDAPVLEQIFYNVASIPANIIGGATAFVEDAVNIVKGDDINPYSYAHRMQNFAQAVRQDTANDINEATGGAALPFVGTTWGDVYQALMSGADSLVGSTLGGTGYGILMGMGAASSEAKELYEKGASMGQIAAGSILAGAVEMVFEKVSIDHFVKMGDTKSLKTFVVNVLKQGGVESSEEMLTEIANTLTDAIVMGTQSDWQGYIDQYVSQGYSESEATVKALFKDVAPNVINAGIGGFISGGGMGSIGSIGSYANYMGKVKEHGQGVIKEGGVDTLKALALEMAGVKDSPNAKSIGKLAGKVDSKASAKNVGRLSVAVGETVNTQNVTDVQNALTEKGLSKSEAKRVAAYLTNSAELTAEQQAEIKDNEKIAEVVKDLVNNKDSVLNQRKLNLLAARLGVDMKNSTINAKTTKTDGVALKNDVDVSEKVSEGGKTIKVSTGEEITIDKNDAIAKTKVVDGERVVYYNTDHGLVEATDVTYASKEDGLLFEAFSDMNPAFANAAIKNYDGSVPVQTYINGMREGIVLYGMHNFQAVGKDISRNSDLAELSEADQSFALKLGRAYAKANVKKHDNALRTAIKNAAEKAEADSKASGTAPKKGKVRFESGVAGGKLNRTQRRTVSLAKYLAEAIGIDIVFYDAMTTTDENGKKNNGYFDPKDNSIHLDLQNAVSDSKTIAFTLSHELVHFIKKWSPAKFKAFADFLMEQYAEHGVSTSTLLANKMAALGTTDADYAYEEMICDACERMLLDSNAVVKLMELRKSDLELFEKVKLHILQLLNKIRDAFKGVDPNTEEGISLQKMEDVLGKLHEMFEDAAVDAAKTYQEASKYDAEKVYREAQALNAESVSVSEDGTMQMQMKQYQQTGRSTLLNYLKEQYGDSNANDLIATIDNIYNVMAEIKEDTALSVFGNWQDTDVELDENGHPIFTTSINNGDYVLNQDFSRVCKKRRQLDFVLNMLAEDPAFEASNLTKQDFVKINKAIKAHGFEIACALCFVDSKRFRQAEWADSFANTWNDILNSVVTDSSKLTPFNFATKNPNIADDGIEIDTSKAVTYRKWSDGKEDVKNRRTYDSFDQILSKEGDKWIEGNTNVRTIATLIRDNPNLRHTFRGADIIASQGFDSIQRLAPSIRSILDGWGGSSVPKPSSNDASYDSSIINIKGYNKETAYAMGGVRMNSFSDFMAHMFFDYCQAFADLSAKELPSQAYTKELIYVRFFGRSGQKINMSGIAAIRDNSLSTVVSKGVSKAEAEANEKIEKMIAGLDVTRLLEHLNKDIYQLTEADVEQFLDMCDYVWADESINMKHATLLQTGILYDKLSDSKIEECYELLKAGEIDKALKAAGEKNVDTEYAKNCGTIVVGVSDAHIRKLLRDPTVRMVIPYHKSGLNPVIARELNIAVYNDYTSVQNTGVVRKGTKARSNLTSTEIKDAYGLKDFAFYDWFGKTIDGKVYDGKATAEKYLEWCEKGYYDESVGDYVYYTTKQKGYILASELHKKLTIEPKFMPFTGEENYYKLLEDFDCYNTITGEHSAQEAVDFLRKGLPSDYKDVLVKALKAEQKVSDDFRDRLDNKGLKDEIMNIVKAHGYTPSETSKDDGIKAQAKKTSSIMLGMSDAERSEILNSKSIVAPIYEGQADALIAEKKAELESRKIEFAKTAIVEIAEKLEMIGKEINFNDVEVKIILSKSNLSESISKEATPEQIAKLLPVLSPTAENSVVIERHNNRYYYDTDTVYFDNLLGAYVDGDSLVPVRFGLKHSRTGTTTLYVVVDQNKVALEKLGKTKKDRGLQDASSTKAESSNLRRSVAYSISQIVSFVNSKDLLRYLPDDMLDSAQKRVKWEAIAATIKRTNDKNDYKYKKYIESGNLKAAQQMVDAAAKAAGYTTKGYHGTGEDFNVFSEDKIGKRNVWGKGFYFGTSKGIADDYASWRASKGGTYRIISAYLKFDNPYIPSKSSIGSAEEILDRWFPDMWKTSRELGVGYIKGKLDGATLDLLQFIAEHNNIEVKDVLTEYGYDGVIDGGELVAFNAEQIKYSDPITYDDNGNIIPISERFNSESNDIRYQKKTTTNRALLANALESTAQNDIEKNKLAQYKSKIELIESEQAKLAEVRAKANELRFTKGRTPDETKQMKALDFEANQIANRINTYDRQLLNLESTAALKNVLQREKEQARKRAEQKGKEALVKYKEKSAQTQRELMNRYQDARKRGIESRGKTEMRHKIKDIVSKLNSLLLDPTKDKHVPIGLQKPVAAALDIINMDTVGAEERIAKYDALIAKEKNPDVIESLKQSRDRIALQGENLADKLAALKAAYADIKNSEDQLIKNSHNEAIESLIENTIDVVGNTSLRDMSLKQLESVYDMYKAILATVRNANKMFKEGKQETVTANSEAVKAEVKAAGGHRERVLKATKFLKKFGWNMLKPIYAMKLIGSNTFTRLYENVRKGEDTWAVDVNEAKEFFQDKRKKYNYDSWDFKKQYTFEDSAGNSFSLSLEQIMSLYAYSKREQADLHLENGGFIFDDAIEITVKNKLGIPMKYEVNDANPYRLNKEDLGAVIGILDTDLKDVKGFVDEMQAYLSDVMGAKGNEVSLAMYDIKLYNEKHYFPLKTAKYFREFDPEKNGTPKIRNSGFSKKTVPKAGNPIVLSNFMDVWANHVNDMSMYHAFVLPLEDFMRVYNYSSTAGGYDSVQQYIKNAYGLQANTYVETLMNDLNGGARTDPATDLIGKSMSLFKKAAVFASASVVIQQPSAIARALAYIDPKYFVDKPEATKHKETWAEVKKYAPVAIIKEMGYFDTNMGRSTVDWIRDEKTLMDKIDDVASKAPALADELAWCAIWKAVKREIAATTNLKAGSEEFLKAAGDRFTEVVTKTQVYDSVLSRSALMRSKDTGAKMITAFMAEPTTSLNMVVDAIIEGKRGNKKFAGKVIGAVSASIILNSILVSLVTAARDDDDDETYTEKYLESLTAELIDGFNPLTYIPLVKDVWSIMQGYDIERSDMSIWSDLWQSVENLFSDKKSGFEKTEGIVGSIASIFGLPAKNLMRDARAMFNLAKTLTSGTPTTRAGVGEAIGGAIKSSIPLYSRVEKWVGADESKSDKLYEAIMSGDTAHIERLKSGYKDEKALNTAIRSALRENDSRIKEAAQARIDGNIPEYTRIVREIISEGNFVQDIVVGAVNAEINAINSKADEQDETTEEDASEKVSSIYRGSDINDAFESGNNALAREIIDDLIDTKVANGMEEKNAKSSVKSSITSYWKPIYKAAYKAGNTEEMKRIRLILKESGIYGSTSDILDTCKGWLKEN